MKAYSCKEHDTLKKPSGNTIQISKRVKSSKSQVLTLISKGFLETHHNFLFNDCYDYGLCEVDSKNIR